MNGACSFPRRLAALALCLASLGAAAQSHWRQVAVPYYGADAYAQGAALALVARADRFATASRSLVTALNVFCAAPKGALPSLQAPWAAAVAAWDGLAVLATGPLVERRSARSIDFMPARPELLARAVASAPKDVVDLERVGATARGFPALELLLFGPGPVARAAPATPECDYAQLVAADIEREAAALLAAAGQRIDTPAEGEAAEAQLLETTNQWAAGVEQLRWVFMRKPIEVAQSRGTAPAYPRSLSRQTATGWAARWQTLMQTAVLGSRAVPVPGREAVPFETLLRGRGLNPLADQLVEATNRTDRALRGLRAEQSKQVMAASEALAALGTLMQDAVAPALGVQMAFSDADGD